MKVSARVALAVAIVLAGGGAAGAQSLAYPPSTHDPGCGGLFCVPIDPREPQPAGPPCQGLLCDFNPKAMQKPMTAADLQEAEKARADAAARETAPPRKIKDRKHVAARKVRAATAASRTPDPTDAAR